METFAARLASFDTVIYPEGRTSGAKHAQPISWPYDRPSPTELAKAGFYYNPYTTNPDNTTCFLCNRALDGWEEDDDPTTEHLKHAGDCGWAIMMDILRRSNDPDEIEDPTSDRIVEARRSTFATGWPHEGKRGWVCQSEKMVEGGWYFCPSEEGDDLATCAYCNLSLDGWEPKDVPYDEHYRRSPNCAFFAFARSRGKKTKGSRSKKTRGSKSSRLSNQSVSSVVSEAPTVDLDDRMDQSIMSQSSTKPKASKKPSKPRGKKTNKTDTGDADSHMSMESTDPKPEGPRTKRTTKGKKRPSDEVEKDELDGVHSENLSQPEPPVKRRATRSRSSAIQQQYGIDENMDNSRMTEVQEEPLAEEKPKKNRKTTKKDSSSKTKKASETLLSNKPASRPRFGNSELDRELEADLELENSHAEEQSEYNVNKPSKSKSNKVSKTVIEESASATDAAADDEQTSKGGHDEMEVEKTELSPEKTKPNKGNSKQKAAKKPKEQTGSNREASEAGTSPGPDADNAGTNYDHHDSFVSVEIISRDPLREPTAESIHGDTTEKTQKKRSSAGKGKQAKRPTEEGEWTRESSVPGDAGKLESRGSMKKQMSEEKKDNIPEPEQGAQEPEEENVVKQYRHRRSSKVPPKTAERYSDLPQEQHFADSIARSRVSNINDRVEETSIFADRLSTVSPLPPGSATTKSPFQSSDAENHPPSVTFSKASVSRTPFLSSPEQQKVWIPVAAGTPSPSKRIANSGHLQTSYPWKPIDIDEMLFAGASDKENDDIDGILNVKGSLSSPEKRMTVEEWIIWNAKNGEERLRRECERLVSHFEREGGRALRALEGIECTD